MIRNKADVNAKSWRSEETPLHVQKYNADILGLLIKHRANVHAKDRHAITPLEYVLDVANKPLHPDIEKQYQAVVQKFIRAGAMLPSHLAKYQSEEMKAAIEQAQDERASFLWHKIGKKAVGEVFTSAVVWELIDGYLGFHKTDLSVFDELMDEIEESPKYDGREGATTMIRVEE